MPTRPSWVEICTHSLEENFRFLCSLAGPEAELLAIVKANAYGHSLALCGPVAVRAGAGWLGVTSVVEGIAARAACPEPRVVVIGSIFAGQGPAVIAHRLTPVVWELGQLGELEGAALTASLPGASLAVHLEIDTGMSRQGVSLDGLGPVLARFGTGSPLRLEGIMTHLYASDEASGTTTEAQLSRLDEALGQVEMALQEALRPEWLSVGASAALLGGEGEAIAALARRRGLKAMMRPGLALYGVAPRFAPPFEAGHEPGGALATARAHLQPVMSWKAQVVSVRAIPAGTEVGYNGTFVATEPMHLALLAVGYADGLDRRLGNRFSLLVRGERAPIVGRISMDHTVLDVTEIAGVKPGDEVVILGSQGEETITAYDHAEAAETIPWEVFTRIGARVPRIEVRGPSRTLEALDQVRVGHSLGG